MKNLATMSICCQHCGQIPFRRNQDGTSFLPISRFPRHIRMNLAPIAPLCYWMMAQKSPESKIGRKEGSKLKINGTA